MVIHVEATLGPEKKDRDKLEEEDKEGRQKMTIKIEPAGPWFPFG
jgi:hypothetical protein